MKVDLLLFNSSITSVGSRKVIFGSLVHAFEIEAMHHLFITLHSSKPTSFYIDVSFSVLWFGALDSFFIHPYVTYLKMPWSMNQAREFPTLLKKLNCDVVFGFLGNTFWVWIFYNGQWKYGLLFANTFTITYNFQYHSLMYISEAPPIFSSVLILIIQVGQLFNI